MPLTPYHLGPNSLVGLLFKRWLDLPVFVAAGFVVDVEVLFIEKFHQGEYIPRYAHTLLVSAAIGVGLAVLMVPFKKPCMAVMKKIGLPYRSGFVTMVLSGVLGAWLHVIVDGFYRTGVGIFWPLDMTNPFCRYSRKETEHLCVLALAAAVCVYLILAARRSKKKRT